MAPLSTPITQLLDAASQGDSAARDRLWTLVYEELRRLARHQLASEGGAVPVQPTTLVHEAYLRLTAGQDVEWANRRHFFAAAARSMRQIRVDYARRSRSFKRGGQAAHVDLPDGVEPPVFDQDPSEVLAVSEVLDGLEQKDPRKAEIVMLKYFAGLTGDETARALDISPRTVDSEWRVAKAWLHRALSKGDTAAK
jgi:RNA polymerase sigma factor (TIGR02999 family)